MRLKTRVITSVVGLGVLALVLCFFDTLVFNVCLLYTSDAADEL